jgi:hypothetical protein
MQFELGRRSNDSDSVVDVRRSHEEIQIPEVGLDGHLKSILLFGENHSAFCEIHPDVDDISREELEALNAPNFTTLG